MRTTTHAIAAALVAIVFASAATAQDDQSYTVYGHGARSCGSWTTAPAIQRVGFQSWALGFLSGAGYAGDFTIRRTDAGGVTGWLDKYCREHPLEDISDGAAALVLELRER